MYDIENYISKLNESYGNDQKLGRFIYDIDYMKRIQSLYSKTLDDAGLNVADPFLANMRYFNRTGDLSNLDPPYVGKTFLFMTRPDLNFRSPYNLSAYPIFEYFSKTRVGKYLIGLLQRPGSEMIGGEGLAAEYCIKSAFNPMITNLAKSTSGSKDLIMETRETEGDYAGNKLTVATGADETYTVGEITVEFRDTIYSPILFYFILWFTYIHGLCKGILKTDYEYIVNKILDYTCSIYILMLDKDHKTIQRFVKYTGCFPRNVPFGAIQHSTEIDLEVLKNVSMTFVYNRYEPMNPETLIDFNILSREFVFKKAPRYCMRTNSFSDNPKRQYKEFKGEFDINKPFENYRLPDKLLNSPFDDNDPFWENIPVNIDPFDYVATHDDSDSNENDHLKKRFSSYMDQKTDFKYKAHPYIFGNHLEFI